MNTKTGCCEALASALICANLLCSTLRNSVDRTRLSSRCLRSCSSDMCTTCVSASSGASPARVCAAARSGFTSTGTSGALGSLADAGSALLGPGGTSMKSFASSRASAAQQPASPLPMLPAVVHALAFLRLRIAPSIRGARPQVRHPSEECVFETRTHQRQGVSRCQEVYFPKLQHPRFVKSQRIGTCFRHF